MSWRRARELFERHARDGHVEFLYDTRLHVGQVSG